MKNIALLLLACCALAACDNASNTDMVGANTGCTVVDYRNGVYYFDCVEDVFGNALSRFIHEHPELRVVTMSGNGTDIHGYDTGYFVVTEVR